MKGKNFSCNNASGKRSKSDFYQTPYSLTRMLLDELNIKGCVYEPAEGSGAIVKILKEYGLNVVSNDLPDNFLEAHEPDLWNLYRWIITNPPYSLAFEFIQKAKKVCNNFAFLLPLSYLHGKKRHDEIYQDKEFPLHDVYVFTRYPLLEETVREDGKHKTGMMVYAWYVWKREKREQGPEIHWLDNDKYVVRGKE